MLLKLILLSCGIALGAAAAIEKDHGSEKINRELGNNTEAANDEVIILHGPLEHCEPGRRYKIDCNTCFCSKTGIMGCTLMACGSGSLKPIQYPKLPDGPCEEGKQYQKDCNRCFCSKGGVPQCETAVCPTNSDKFKELRANNEVILAEKTPRKL